MMARMLFVLLVLVASKNLRRMRAISNSLLVISIVELRRYVVCDPPCQTGGHVPTCCSVHGFNDGYCSDGEAYCD